MARRLKWTLGGLLGFVIVTTGLFAWVLGTDSGRRMLVDRVNDIPGVEVGTLGPGLPGHLQATGVRLADGEGDWLVLDAIDAVWSPSKLLQGTLWIDSVTLSGLDVRRAPAPAAAAPPEPAPENEAFRLPVDIHIGEIRADPVTLGAALAGQSVRLAANLSGRYDGATGLRLDAAVRRIDDTPAAMTLFAEFDPNTKELALKAEVNEPAGGVLAGLIGVPDTAAFQFNLDGRGVIGNWHGTLNAGFGDAAKADISFALSGADDQTFGFSFGGTVQPGVLVPAGFRSLAGDPATFAAKGRYVARNQRLDLRTFELENGFAKLTAKADVDLANAKVAATARADIIAPERLQALVADLTMSSVALDVAVAGDLLSPRITADLQTGDLALAGVTLRVPSLTAVLEPSRAFQFRLNVEAVHGDALPGLLPSPVELIANGRMTANRYISIHSLTGRTDWLSLRGAADLDLETRRVAGQVGATVDDLSVLRPLAGIDLAGMATADLLFDAALDPLSWRATLAAAGGDLRLGDPALNGLVGPEPSFVADFHGGPDGAVVADTLNASIGVLSLDGTASMQAGGTGHQSAVVLTIPDLASLGADLAGRGTVRIATRGTFADPAATVVAELVDVMAPQINFDTVALRVVADHLVQPDAGLTLQTTGPTGPLNVQARVRQSPDGRLSVSDLVARGLGVAVQGQVAVEPATALLDGTFEVQIPSLGPLAVYLGQQFDGAVSARVGLGVQDGAQTIDLQATVANLSANGISLAEAQIAAQAVQASDGPRGQMVLNARDLVAGGAKLTETRVSATGTAAAFQVDLQTKGALAKPIDVRARIAGELAAATRIALTELSGQLGDAALGLTRPLNLVLSDGKVMLDGALKLGPGTIELATQPRDGMTALRATIGNLPLDVATVATGALPVEGTLNAAITAMAKGQHLQSAAATIEVRDLKPAGDTDIRARLLAEARIDGTQARAQGSLEGPWRTPLTFSAEVPMRMTETMPSPPPGAPLAGVVNWQGDIGEFLAFMPLPGQVIGGPAAIDVQLGGTIDQPVFAGRASLRGGSYENLEFSTHLSDIQAAVTFDPDQNAALTLTAGDGQDGRLTTRGIVHLGDAITARIETRLTGMQLIEREDIRLRANGEIDYAGTLPGGAVRGAITLEPIEVFLLDRLPANVEGLDLVEANAGPEPETAPVEPITLDIRVVVPKRAFIRGRGLDTEWNGEITVTGTSAEPRIDGALGVRRGHVDFLARRFKIIKGDVTLDGLEPDPILGIRATHSRQGTLFTIAIDGPASAPKLSFSADPQLPEDEVLARLLFGKSATDLSTTEALQLAQGVATLDSGGPGIMDRVRSAFGLDVLTTETSETGETVVKAGTYAAEGVYVGVNRAIGTGESTLSVEAEVTPEVIIETEIGQGTEGNIGLSWQRRY